MSKKEKRIAKLCAVPPPKDFTWSELISVMRAAGFTEYCDGGSHYTFEHISGFSLVISRTHPSGILKRYQVDDVKEALRYLGIIEGDENGSS